MAFLSRNRYAPLLSIVGMVLWVTSTAVAQDESRFDEYLSNGEFSLALQLAGNTADQRLADAMRSKIAVAQSNGGARNSAFTTAGQIQDDATRFGSLRYLASYGSGNNYGFGNTGNGANNQGRDSASAAGNPAQGLAGGISEQDFFELINLIQETIDPDSWEENGGNGRMMPFPAGVFVDSQGTLKRINPVNDSRLDQIRRDAARDADAGQMVVETQLRKVSLSKLERALQVLVARGEEPTPQMRHLAGIYRLQYVMFYPESRDVVIAGPAGPWHYDQAGRAIHTSSGTPVLDLDDLVVCIRNARIHNGQFGCSIDPRPENLAAAKSFLESTSLQGKAWREGLRSTLGFQDVVVDGIPGTSHAARVIVEADYRMKLVGMGLEPGVSGLKSYFDRLHLDDAGNPPPSDLIRWWFTMNYDAVQTNPDRTIFELNGQGVKVLSESEFLDETGQRVHTGRSSAATKGFAEDFTRHFVPMARKYSVYGQLKNLFDCALAANLIFNEGLNRHIDWKLSFFDAKHQIAGLTYPLAVDQVPVRVHSITGQRVMTHRDGRRTVSHTIVGISGGVVYDASQIARRSKLVTTNDKQLDIRHTKSAPVGQPHDWWWD